MFAFLRYVAGLVWKYGAQVVGAITGWIQRHWGTVQRWVESGIAWGTIVQWILQALGLA